VFSILRLVVVFKADFEKDPSWFGVETSTWTTTEPGAYLIAGCLPSLRSLFGTTLKSLNIGTRLARLTNREFRSFSRRPCSTIPLSAINRRSKEQRILQNPTINPKSYLKDDLGEDSDERELVVGCWDSEYRGNEVIKNLRTDLERG
jgi:hypothetical protein